MGSCKCVYDTAPDTSLPPANEAVIASGVRAERLRQIAPGRSRSQNPENTVEHTAIVYPRNPTRLIGQHRLDGGPFIIGEFIAHDSGPPVWEFESQASDQTQCSRSGLGTGAAIGEKRTSTSRQSPLNRSKMTRCRPLQVLLTWAARCKAASVQKRPTRQGGCPLVK